ncbi:hypothetical protein IT072_03060 [Leifsonia sp. ZF2019]|uniref:SGNH hydrolase domain-containing protein n=1 Tax=Leifsonia sp. ZF2019 TaxID=2781978 RepID=UPI001CBF4D53|nr:SGNH hydrolase domain-containing protein [Leifsonia sp. ZF2019]UAJ80062.1 hypothetical protein IT072_03060 [Leifsonia sp. ZF2019]
MRKPLTKHARALLTIAALGVTVIGASIATFGIEQARMNEYRSFISESSASSSCIGAPAIRNPDCGNKFSVLEGLDAALAASDVGIVEGSMPFIDGCAQELIGAEILSKHCRWNQPNATRTIAIVGDSHAAQWADALLAVAPQRRWNVEVYFHGGCLASNVDGTRLQDATDGACRAWSAHVADALRERNDIDVIVYGARMGLYVQEYLSKLPNLTEEEASTAVVQASSRFIASWLKDTTPTLIMQDTPDPGVNVPACISKTTQDTDPCSSPRISTASLPTLPLLRRGPLTDHESAPLATQLGLPLVPTSDLVCDTQCHAVIGGIPVYRDDNHLTASFARTAATILSSRVENLTAGKTR